MVAPVAVTSDLCLRSAEKHRSRVPDCGPDIKFNQTAPLLRSSIAHLMCPSRTPGGSFSRRRAHTSWPYIRTMAFFSSSVSRPPPPRSPGKALFRPARQEREKAGPLPRFIRALTRASFVVAAPDLCPKADDGRQIFQDLILVRRSSLLMVTRFLRSTARAELTVAS